MSDKAQCRFCGKDILWTISSETGKRVAVDARPTVAYVLRKATSGDLLGDPVKCHINHWATCPKADEARAAQKAKGGAKS